MNPRLSVPARLGHNWRGLVVDSVIILVFLIVCYPSHLLTSVSFDTTRIWSDLLTHAQPVLEYSGKTLSAGDLPLWNPYWFAGFPHMAMPSSATFYPTTVLFGLISFSHAIKWVVLSHIYLLGFSGYLLARDISGRRLPGLLTALYLVSGSAVHWIVGNGHVWAVQTLAWLPLGMLFLRRILHHQRMIYALGLAGVLVLMILGGDSNSLTLALCWLGVYGLVAVVLFLCIGRLTLERAITSAWLGVMAVLLASLLTAFQLLPSLEFAEQSIRKDGITFEYMTFFFRSSLDEYLASFVTGSPPFLRFGRVGLSLALLSLFFAKARTEVFAVWSATVASVLFSLMPAWFYDLVISHVPVLRDIRAVSRMNWMVIFAVYILSAFGLRALLEHSAPTASTRRRWVLFAALVAGTTILHLTSPAPVDPWLLSAAGVGVGAALIGSWTGRPRRAVPLLMAALAVEALVLDSSDSLEGPAERYVVHEEYRRWSETRTGMDRVAIVSGPEGNLFHKQGTALLTHDRLLGGYHALLSYRYARFLKEAAGFDIFDTAPDGKLRTEGVYLLDHDWITKRSQIALDLFNVRYLIGDGIDLDIPNQLTGDDGGYALERRDGLRVYENTSALPPAFVVHDVRVCSTEEEELRLLARPDFDYRRTATLSRLPAAIDTRTLRQPNERERVEIVSYRPSSIHLEVEMAEPGFLVLSEICYPGWTVTVDSGPRRETSCLNTVLRGVFLERGRHRVAFEYRPVSFRRGVLISVLTALVLAAVWIWSFARRRHAV